MNRKRVTNKCEAQTDICKWTDRKYLTIQREQRRLDKLSDKTTDRNGQTEILKHEHTDRQKDRHL